MEQLIRDLESTRDETVRYFGLNDDDLARTYAPGKWSVRYILQHLTDSETVLYDRIRRVLEKDGHLEFVHSLTGVRTLKDEFDKTASHNEHHLSQIRRALN